VEIINHYLVSRNITALWRLEEGKNSKTFLSTDYYTNYTDGLKKILIRIVTNIVLIYLHKVSKRKVNHLLKTITVFLGFRDIRSVIVKLNAKITDVDVEQ